MSVSSVVAILVADIHLSLTPPIARLGEPDWFEAMARSLKEMGDLAIKYWVPILCAGDVFDRWNSSPALINFALDNLPQMYAVPGQHDLPLHRYEDIHRSAFGTLVRAGVVISVPPGNKVEISTANGELAVFGFPWGTPLVAGVGNGAHGDDHLKIALVHSFLWMDKKTGYTGAPESSQLNARMDSFKGWDAVAFGDNHKGFLTKIGTTSILNCGTFLRRCRDEVAYRPHIGLLRANGKIDLHYLDTSKDIIEGIHDDDSGLSQQELEKFVGDLKSLGGESLDFVGAIENSMRTCNVGVREILLEVMDSC